MQTSDERSSEVMLIDKKYCNELQKAEIQTIQCHRKYKVRRTLSALGLHMECPREEPLSPKSQSRDDYRLM